MENLVALIEPIQEKLILFQISRHNGVPPKDGIGFSKRKLRQISTQDMIQKILQGIVFKLYNRMGLNASYIKRAKPFLRKAMRND